MEVERPHQDETLNLPLTIEQMVLTNLKHPMTTFRTIVVVGDYVALVREVPAVVGLLIRRVEAVDFGVAGLSRREVEGPALAVGDEVPPRDPDQSQCLSVTICCSLRFSVYLYNNVAFSVRFRTLSGGSSGVVG